MTDEEAVRLAMQGKIIRCCADCVYFEKHKCQLGYNKESNPRDRFFDDCSLEDIEKHDAEVRADERKKVKQELWDLLNKPNDSRIQWPEEVENIVYDWLEEQKE